MEDQNFFNFGSDILKIAYSLKKLKKDFKIFEEQFVPGASLTALEFTWCMWVAGDCVQQQSLVISSLGYDILPLVEEKTKK